MRVKCGACGEKVTLVDKACPMCGATHNSGSGSNFDLSPQSIVKVVILLIIVGLVIKSFL